MKGKLTVGAVSLVAGLAIGAGAVIAVGQTVGTSNDRRFLITCMRGYLASGGGSAAFWFAGKTRPYYWDTAYRLCGGTGTRDIPTP